MRDLSCLKIPQRRMDKNIMSNIKRELLTIGQMAKRCGVSPSALRFYESRGLIQSIRGKGNQRRYARAMLRKVSIIRIAQTLGLSLVEIAEAFESLPRQRTPTKKDWQKLSREWQDQLEQRIAGLQSIRDQLSACIGCGCLSLKQCSLYNPNDYRAGEGPGPRVLMDKPGH